MEQPEAGPDLVGRTSARLLAAGVDRRQRLDALHLLAILDASTDMHGRVRRPLDDLAGEFELDPLSVLRSLDHLEHVDAVQRDGGHVLLLGASPEGLGGMQLADFLDDVRASFEGEMPPVAPRSGWIARSGAALVAAAAAVSIFAIAPGQDTVGEPLAAGGAVSTTIEHSSDTTESELDAPIERIRPSTTIVAPAVTAPLDTTVVAAQAPEEDCDPTSTIADRVDCIIDHDLVGDGGDGLPQDAPIAPEQTAPPATQELPPPAPDIDAPTTPAATVLDLQPAVDPTDAVLRPFRS